MFRDRRTGVVKKIYPAIYSGVCGYPAGTFFSAWLLACANCARTLGPLTPGPPESLHPSIRTPVPADIMPTFSAKKFMPSSGGDNKLGALYRRHLAKHPFLLFGLPFIATIVAGSFWLTPATALRYEKNDRKIKRLSQDEAMGLDKDRRRIDLNEEYYVSDYHARCVPSLALTNYAETINERRGQLGAKTSSETQGRV